MLTLIIMCIQNATEVISILYEFIKFFIFSYRPNIQEFKTNLTSKLKTLMSLLGRKLGQLCTEKDEKEARHLLYSSTNGLNISLTDLLEEIFSIQKFPKSLQNLHF